MENKWIRATRNWMASNCANEWTLSPRMNMRSCQLHLFVFATAAWTGDDWWRLLLISHVCHLDYERIIAKIGWSKHATHTHMTHSDGVNRRWLFDLSNGTGWSMIIYSYLHCIEIYRHRIDITKSRWLTHFEQNMTNPFWECQSKITARKNWVINRLFRVCVLRVIFPTNRCRLRVICVVYAAATATPMTTHTRFTQRILASSGSVYVCAVQLLILLSVSSEQKICVFSEFPFDFALHIRHRRIAIVQHNMLVAALKITSHNSLNNEHTWWSLGAQKPQTVCVCVECVENAPTLRRYIIFFPLLTLCYCCCGRFSVENWL